jgi:glucose/mannose-6-phosphate isomerase
MKILDDFRKIRKKDTSFVLASLEAFPYQVKQTWQELEKIKIPTALKEVDKILVVGMGGSALGARIIDALAFEVLDLPLEIINGYHLPAYADKQTLVIVSSYSGNTEETLSGYKEAINKNCPIFAVTTGGQLAKMAKRDQTPAYILKPKYNPSGQPRLGLGYSILAQLGLLAKCGFVRLNDSQVGEVFNYLQEIESRFALETPLAQNEAKKLAHSLKGKLPILVASEHLIGASHVFKNMLNENAKTFAAKFALPEMNHHLLEGLMNPRESRKVLKFLFLDSEFYDPPIQKRFQVTQDVIRRNEVETEFWQAKGRTRLIQVFETIYLAAFVSFYLAILYRVDPANIPWVDYFKKMLKKDQ